MPAFDVSQAQWLAVVGVLYDVIGAVILSRAFIWSQPAQMAVQTETRWSGNSELLKALCEQTVDAKWGAALLVVGFILQALSAAGLKFSPVAATMLALTAAPAFVTYRRTRLPMIRKRYMKAVDALSGDERDKQHMRDSFVEHQA